jgi:plastocyanin
MNSRMTLTIGGLLLVAATAAACGGSGMGGSYSSPTSPTPTSSVPPPAPTGAAADVTITIVGMNGSNSYSPNPVTVRVGQTVSWRNGDAVAHTATADGGAFDTGSIAPGASSSPLAANTAGTFPYHCAIHGFVMTGTLIVQ